MLELQYKGGEEWTPCFDVPNVKIPSVSYLGFSAETGELSDNFDIINVQTKNLYQPGPSANQRVRQEQNRQKSQPLKADGGGSSSWGWFFLKVVLFLLVVAGAYAGFTFWRSSRRSSRF